MLPVAAASRGTTHDRAKSRSRLVATNPLKNLAISPGLKPSPRYTITGTFCPCAYPASVCASFPHGVSRTTQSHASSAARSSLNWRYAAAAVSALMKLAGVHD